MRITPDGRRYLRMAEGHAEPLPFALRRGLPQICRTSGFRWVVANVVSMVYAAAGIGVLASQHGATLEQSILASALFLGLPWVRFCWKCPVLVDMPALMCAVLAAVAWPVSPFASVAILIVGAYISERVPIWAAIFAWEPILLLGLIVPLLNYALARRAVVSDDDPHADILRHPIRTGLGWHRGKWLSLQVMILPWGACLVAATDPSVWRLAALGAGYAQLLLATDTVRLYQQAAPVVCVVAAMAIPSSAIFVLLILHFFNPRAGGGV